MERKLRGLKRPLWIQGVRKRLRSLKKSKMAITERGKPINSLMEVDLRAKVARIRNR